MSSGGKLPLLTVVETRPFMADVDTLMTPEERMELIRHLAANPDAGDLMPGTGGARKLRWARPGQGKRGGFRIITFFQDWDTPLFLLAIFGKNERSDLSQAEKNELRDTLKAVADAYVNRRKNQ